MRVMKPWLSTALLFLGACSPQAARELGQPVEAAEALSLDQLLDAAPAGPRTATVRGRVGEVCRSAGCWLVLRETDGQRVSELWVDLEARADFRLGPEALGRTVVVRGELQGALPDLRLVALGLRFEDGP